jgi:hypothetical protein
MRRAGCREALALPAGSGEKEEEEEEWGTGGGALEGLQTDALATPSAGRPAREVRGWAARAARARGGGGIARAEPPARRARCPRPARRLSQGFGFEPSRPLTHVACCLQTGPFSSFNGAKSLSISAPPSAEHRLPMRDIIINRRGARRTFVPSHSHYLSHSPSPGPLAQPKPAGAGAGIPRVPGPRGHTGSGLGPGRAASS